MSSSTQICNIALSKIGEDTILSLADDTRAGRACNTVYSDTRQAVLRSHHWNFAVARVELALLASTPAYEFVYKHQLPSDLLKIIATDQDQYHDFKYRIEGRELLSDSSSLFITYIKDVTDELLFDALFREALSARLAAELSVFLTDDETLRDRMVQEADSKIREARTMNSQEGTPEGFIASTWINSRL